MSHPSSPETADGPSPQGAIDELYEGPASEERPSVPRQPPANWPDEEASTRTTDAHIQTPAASVRTTRAVLTVVSGPGVGHVYTVRNDETLLGRGKEAHIRLEDSGASRVHARIVVAQDGRYLLEDLRSTNGTFVDGRRIDRVELQSGDRFHIGPTVTLSFAILDAQAERITHQLYESSVRDPLTRAHNRRYLLERLTAEIAYARRHSTSLAVVMFDLDHFKRVNDTRGHLAGDDVLRGVAALVLGMIRAEDVLARFGGEEFVVVVRGIEHDNVGRFAERLRGAVERLDVASEGTSLQVTMSAGWASLDELAPDERDPDDLLRLADERLYRAKTGGRNRTCGR